MGKRKEPRLVNGSVPGSHAKATKFWNIASVSDDEGEITLYGEVVSSQPIDFWTGEALPGLYISPEGFLDDLEAVKGKSKITVKLNSVGGDLYTGIAIHNAIKGLAGSKTVIVEGIAASAASVIMCSGDEVVTYPGSLVMIHGVSALFYNYYNITDLKQVIKGFDAAERAIAEIYSAKTGLDVETLRSMMTKETWMTGKEAVDKGFANKLLEGSDPQMIMSTDKSVLLVNGIKHSIKGLHNIPKGIPVNSVLPAAPKGLVDGIEKPNGGGKKTMDMEELKKQHPELVAQIEAASKGTISAEAIAAERARIKDIESIESAVGDPQLVAEAKYGDAPCTAAELSLKALQKQAQLGKQHLDNSANDFNASGAKGIGAAPNAGNQDDEPDEAQQVNAIVDVYNKMKNGGKK
ncbi:MAG: peptidase [Desulfosporosinus sp. BRH_c37]|nr:MAG: peptidase [Desulfosporosinus sp. BRH_c37]